MKQRYNLTRKGRQFIWEEEQQNAFEGVIRRLQEQPILHLPDKKGRFHLYSDTCRSATGSALYHIQTDEPKQIAYANKRMPETAIIDSIT